MDSRQDKFEENAEKAAALAGDARAIQHLKDSVRQGRNWYISLLEAVRLWKSSSEEFQGEQYIYLIGGEAFDWLRLAERLCEEIREYVPENELVNLLFFDRPPVETTDAEFKQMLGPAKYRAYLNYLYGVLTEQALIMAAVYEVRKGSIVPLKSDDEAEKAFKRVYGVGQSELLYAFQKEKKYLHRKSVTLGEWKEFTYWLFKYRVHHCEKPRIASDTKKALLLMYRKMSGRSV
jgi:hypothetical protein